MFKPAKLNSEWVRPIDPNSQPLFCVNCLEDTARWILGTPENSDAWCAYCVLYNTEWGRGNAESIDGLIKAVEENMGRKISGGDDRVYRIEAHRIIGAIVASSRLYESARNKK